MKNRQTKRTFYSNTVNNTVKNSLIVADKDRMLRLNRIDSDVVSYNYEPNPKYRSSVTIKATTTNRQYGVSKFSNNNLSVITNGKGKMFYDNFQDKEDA